MAITRIKNNQITDATIVGSTKIVANSVTSGLLENDLTYGSNLTVTGNLTVSGTTTTINTANTSVEDSVLLLASAQTGAPALDIGILGERGTGTNVAMIWDESLLEWAAGYTSASGTANAIPITSYANMHVNDITVDGASNFTGATTLGSLIVTGATDLQGDTQATNINAATLDTTGNVTIGGTLITTGLTTNNGGTITSTLQATGAVDFNTTLNVDGNTTLVGTAIISGLLSPNGGINVDSGNFTVDGTSGAVSTVSTLSADGAATFNADLTMTGGAGDVFLIQDGAAATTFSVDTTNGNTLIAGTLSAGETTVSSATISDLTDNRVVIAGVSGAIEDDANFTFDGTTLAVGAFSIVQASGNTLVGGTIGVTGEATLASATVSDLTATRLVLAGTAGALQDDANLTFDGTTFNVGTAFDVIAASGNTLVGGTLTVTGATDLNGALTTRGITVDAVQTLDAGANKWTNLADPTVAQDAATKAYIDAEVAAGWTITDGTTSQIIKTGTLGDSLTLTGTANEVDVAVSATDIMTIGLPSDVTIANNLTVIAAASVGTTLGVTGNTTLSTLTATGAATLNSTLGVTGTSVFTDTATMNGALIANGTSALNGVNTFSGFTVAPTQLGETAWVNGTVYVITSAGDTDFTAIGAADSNVGTIFTYDNTTPETGTTGTVELSAAINMGGSLITNVADPVNAQDAVTLAYVNATSAAGWSITDGTTTETVAGGDTLTIAGTANEVDVIVTATDTLTIGLPNDVTVSNNLTVTALATLNGGVSADNFSVADTTGNTLVGGTLGVTGVTTTANVNTTGVLTVTGSAIVDDITINGSSISSAAATNITLDPNGVGGTSGDVIISGNLQVLGTTTTVSSTTVVIADPVYTIGSDAVVDTLDRGTEFKYNNGVGAALGFFGWDQSTNEFIFIDNATNTTEVMSGALGAAAFGSLRVEDLTDTRLVFTSGVNGELADSASLTFDGTTLTAGGLTTGGALSVTGTSNVGVLNATGLASLDGGIDVDGAFSVANTTGNVLTTGTLNTGAATLASLSVTGVTDLNGALTLTTTTWDAASVINAGANAITNVADPTNAQDAATMAYVDGISTTGWIITDGVTPQTISGGDSLTIAGTANEVDVAVSAVDTLTVGLPSDVTITNNLTVTANTGTATLGVTGISTLAIINASGLASLDGGIDVDGAFTVADVTGNISTTGTLGVTGISTLTGLLNANGGIDVDSGNFTVSGTTGAIATTSTLAVTGISTLTGALIANGGTTTTTLQATGATTLNTTLGVTGDATFQANMLLVGSTTGGLETFTINDGTTTKFSVDSATGDTVVAGTLSAGETTLTSATVSDLTATRLVLAGTAGALQDDANLTYNGTTFEVGTAFDVIAASGNTAIGGTLITTGLTDLNGGLTVGDVTIDATSTLDAGANKWTNLADPTLAQDAATMAYVDSVATAGWNISDGTTTQVIAGDGADTLIIAGTANEVDVAVSAVDTLTIGLPSNVQIANTLGVTGVSTLAATGITGALTVTGSAAIDNIIIDGNAIDATAGTEIVINELGADINFRVEGDTDANTLVVDAGTNSVNVGTATAVTDVQLQVAGTTSVMMAKGTTAQRPAVGVEGMFRYNTTTSQYEYYDTNSWNGFGTEFTVIASETFNGDDSTTVFTLASAQTTASVIIHLNGVAQQPTTAYAVVGTTLTFTAAPATGDVIEVRSLTTTTSINGIDNGVVSIVTGTDLEVTGHLVPTTSITYDLGTASNRFRDVYLSGNTIDLGGLQIKNDGTNIAFFGSDGTTPVELASASSTGGQSTGITDNVSFNNVTVNGSLASDDITAATMTASGNVVVQGNLTVNGTTTTINSTTLTVTDATIVASSGTTDDASANGAGFIFGGHGTAGQLTYVSATDRILAGNVAGIEATTFYGESTAAQYADLAEIYSADAEISPGTVVCFGGDAEVTTCLEDGDRRVAGIVSTNPAYLMNSEADGVAVALRGRVPCKVSGSIKKGDMLVSDGKGGARAEADPKLGQVIAKALENSEGEAVIEVVV